MHGNRLAKGYNTATNKDLDSAARTRLSGAYKYDVIVLGRISWKTVPDQIKKLILGKVAAGAGLVYVGPKDADDSLNGAFRKQDTGKDLLAGIQATVPLDILPLNVTIPAEKMKDWQKPSRKIGPFEVKAGKLGEGRVVFLDYHDTTVGSRDLFSPGELLQFLLSPDTIALTPFVENDPLYYDYFYSILGKAILAVAGKETGINVKVVAQNKSVERTKLPAQVVSFNISTANKELKNAVVLYEIRNRENVVVATGNKKSIACRSAGCVLS